jgi:hypothetical protein
MTQPPRSRAAAPEAVTRAVIILVLIGFAGDPLDPSSPW